MPCIALCDHCAAFENGWHGGPPASTSSCRRRNPRSAGAIACATAITSCGSTSRRRGQFAFKLARAMASSSMQPTFRNPAFSNPKSRPPRPLNTDSAVGVVRFFFSPPLLGRRDSLSDFFAFFGNAWAMSLALDNNCAAARQSRGPTERDCFVDFRRTFRHWPLSLTSRVPTKSGSLRLAAVIMPQVHDELSGLFESSWPSDPVSAPTCDNSRPGSAIWRPVPQ